jgi:hypothetical protein
MDVVDATARGGQDGDTHAGAPGDAPRGRQLRSTPPTGEAAAPPAPRRVREDVRDGVAVIAFSAVMSLVMAVVLMLLIRLVG